MIFQQTLANSITVEGVGLHSGQAVTATLYPALENTGIVFVRKDMPNKAASTVPATPHNTHHTPLCTQLINSLGTRVTTVEHLMASLCALGVDNAVIELSAEELPVLDGSALPWVEAIDKAGKKLLEAPRNIHILTSLKTVDIERRVLLAVPDAREGLRLEIMIDFPHPAIGRQELKAKLTEEFFRTEIAPARTFCMKADVDAMQKAGLALGGSLENAVVFEDNSPTPLNKEGLRFPDEPVRHKWLDAIGDLYLGGFIQAKISLPMPGHTANNLLLREIFA